MKPCCFPSKYWRLKAMTAISRTLTLGGFALGSAESRISPRAYCGSLVSSFPPEWYDHDQDELDRLLSKLLERRSKVRALILAFKYSSRNPFPNWRA